jgi:hypothetical protein
MPRPPPLPPAPSPPRSGRKGETNALDRSGALEHPSLRRRRGGVREGVAKADFVPLLPRVSTRGAGPKRAGVGCTSELPRVPGRAIRADGGACRGTLSPLEYSRPSPNNGRGLGPRRRRLLSRMAVLPSPRAVCGKGPHRVHAAPLREGCAPGGQRPGAPPRRDIGRDGARARRGFAQLGTGVSCPTARAARPRAAGTRPRT